MGQVQSVAQHYIHRPQSSSAHCRTGFDCEILSIANCKFLDTSQSKESQEEEYPTIILHMTLPFLLKRSTRVHICMVQYYHIQLSIIEMSIHQCFRSKLNLLTLSQVQLLPNVLREVNQAVTAALERKELGTKPSKVHATSESTCLSCLRIVLLLEGLACSLGSSQSLESQFCLYSTIRNHLTTQSKPVLQ